MIETKSIYISTGSMQSGGTERVISIISKKLVEEGFKVKIFIWRSLPVFYKLDNQIEVIDIQSQSHSSNIFYNIFWFRRFLKDSPPSLLLSFSAPFNMLSIVSKMGIGIKTIVCERNDPRHIPFGKIQRGIRNILYIFADGVLIQTNHNKDYFPQFIKKKTEIIYNPILIDQKYLLSAYRNPKSLTSRKIVSVARLKAQKNQEMLIRAFYRFHKVKPEYELYIYGEGDYRERLESLISDLKMEEYIHLPGVSEDIFDRLLEFETFVLPSNFEGMPNTLIEAMCIGLPCISTKVSGATDLIRDNENGLLIDVNNEEQLYNRLLELSSDLTLRKSIAINASKIFNILNSDTICKKWINYINKFINN